MDRQPVPGAYRLYKCGRATMRKPRRLIGRNYAWLTCLHSCVHAWVGSRTLRYQEAGSARRGQCDWDDLFACRHASPNDAKKFEHFCEISLAAMGNHAGIVGTRRSLAILAVAFTFSVVIELIADFDRPQEGILKVSQHAFLDLQRSMNVRTP